MKIYVVGLGPGEWNQMTQRAAEALEECDVITGYDVYVDLIRERYRHKKLISTPMKKETERLPYRRRRGVKRPDGCHGLQRGRGRLRHGGTDVRGGAAV